eukprot:scaffold187979_cov42-Prasinocladus_malaysianus.AAC.1
MPLVALRAITQHNELAGTFSSYFALESPKSSADLPQLHKHRLGIENLLITLFLYSYCFRRAPRFGTLRVAALSSRLYEYDSIHQRSAEAYAPAVPVRGGAAFFPSHRPRRY